MFILLISINNSSNAQLPVKNYFQVDEDFVVIDSTIFEFTPIAKQRLIELEKQAKAYLKKLQPTTDRYKTAGAYHYIINANYDLKRLDSTLVYSFKALAIPGLSKSKGAIDIHWDIFKIFKYSENYSGQLQQLNILEDLGAQHNFYKETTPSNLNKTRGDVYLTAGFYEKAQSYFYNFITQDSLTVNPVKTAVIYNDLAFVYEKLNKNDSVTKYRNKAFKALLSKRSNPYGDDYKAYIKDFIILHDLKYHKTYNEASLAFAIEFLNNALRHHDGEIHSSIFACQFLAEYFFFKKNFDQALLYIDKALSLGKEKLMLEKLRNLYILKSRILDQLDQFHTSSAVLEELNAIQTQKKAENKTLELIQYEVNLMEDAKEEAEVAAMLNKGRYKKVLFILVISVLLIMLISLGFYTTIQKNKKIKAVQLKVEKELKEKDFLLKELNHRVKNNLSLILSLVKFQSADVKELNPQEKFKHLEQRINTIAIAHEQFI